MEEQKSPCRYQVTSEKFVLPYIRPVTESPPTPAKKTHEHNSSFHRVYCRVDWRIGAHNQNGKLLNMTTNISTYKTVVVLNNIGITLLQRQRYNDAQVTLKDAIDLMSCLREEKTRPQITQEKQSLFLHRASKRIAQSTSSCAMDCDDDATMDVSLTVLSQHDVAQNTKEIVSGFHTSLSRIVHRLEYIDESCVNLATDTAILLHNFSVAILVQLPTVTSSHSHRNSKKLAMHSKLLDFAYKITLVADKMINENIEHICMNICSSDHELHQQYIEALQISMLIVQALMVIVSMMHPDENRKMLLHNYYGKLGHIRAMLLDMHDPSIDSILEGHPAAPVA